MNKIKYRFEKCFDSIKNIHFVKEMNNTGNPESYDSIIWTSKNTCKKINLKSNKSML